MLTKALSILGFKPKERPQLLCACGKKIEMGVAEEEAFLEAKSHFSFTPPPKCRDCR